MNLFNGRAAAWTAVATVIMCVFNVLLWRVNTVANETTVATQKAVLNYGGPYTLMTKSPDATKIEGYGFYFTLANTGSLPARNGVSQSNVYLGVDRPIGALDFNSLPQGTRRKFVAGPKGNIQLESIPVTMQDMEAAAEGKKHLFAWGWVAYNDGFPQTPKRLTEYCVEFSDIRWQKPDHGDLSPNNLQFDQPPCEVHNCYDNDCPDYKARTE